MPDVMEARVIANPIPLLATVALLEDAPAFGLVRGQVGAVVEILAPHAVMVEFVDNQGYTYALETLENKQLILLQHCAVHQAA